MPLTFFQTFVEVKSYAEASSKYAQKRSNGPSETERQSPTIQHKLVLPSLSFPRLRIIWSSSPFAAAAIFNDLKPNNLDPSRAITIEAEKDPDAAAGVNTVAEELVRSLTCITTRNIKAVMSNVRSVRELCEMNRETIQEILGVEPGKACREFMHRDERTRRVGLSFLLSVCNAFPIHCGRAGNR
jgi:DNA excision repair protein ERCC-4